VVMCLRGCDADEAFQHLVKLSQISQRKLHDVAALVVADVIGGHPGAPGGDLTSKAAGNG